jgi:hypothetical protein
MNLFSEWRDTSQMLAYFFAFQKAFIAGLMGGALKG